MHTRTVFAIVRKDTLDIVLNKTSLTVLLMPIFMALLFLGIQSLLGNTPTKILIYDPGRSGIEQLIKQSFTNVQMVYVNAPQDVAAAFGPNDTQKDSSYTLGLVIPAGFEQRIAANQHPRLQLYINGSQVNNQQSALLQNALADYTRQVAHPQPPVTIDVATINPPSNNADLQNLGQAYTLTALLFSFFVSMSLVPNMLIEEKEKKTLRMLMVTPASFADVVVGKLLVGLAYQLVFSLLVLAIKGGFSGQVPIVLLFTLLGSIFGISIGLLVGSVFQTSGAVGAFTGMTTVFYILPIFFVGAFSQLIGNNPFTPVIKILPTYYLADGIANALAGQARWGNTILDGGVLLGCIVVCFLLAVTLLRRQATVVAII